MFDHRKVILPRYIAMRPVALILFPCLIVLAVAQTAMAQRRVGEAIPSSWQEDAELTDVCFTDPEHGWAVGEHGTMLRTLDGGKTWEYCSTLLSLSPQQASIPANMQKLLGNIRSKTGTEENKIRQTVRQNLDVRLESVHFVDNKTGLAVGGFFEPYTDISRGVVFATHDGGESWEPVKGAIFPKLNQVRLQDRLGGWAVGNQSNLLGTGIVTTSDCGSSWQTDAQSVPGNWIDAHRTATGWVLIDRLGEIYVVAGNGLEHAVMKGENLPPINQLEMLDDRRGWAVGDQGTFLVTENGGASWRNAVNAEHQSMLDAFDLHAIQIVDKQVWLAGNPGTFIFSFDFTANILQPIRTSAANKLNSICFPDSQNGFAVGTMGTILRTSDGGKSWQQVRGQSAGLTALVLAFDSDDAAFESLAKMTTAEGYVSAVARVQLRKLEGNFDCLKQAASRLGVSEVRRVNIPMDEKRFDDTKKLTIVSRLTRIIRELQPRIIVLDASTTLVPGGEYIDTFQLVDEAIRRAADAKAFPEYLTATGLTTWQVDRMAIPSTFGIGDWQIDRGGILPQIGKLLDDEIAISKALVGLPISTGGEVNYRVVAFGDSHFAAGNVLTGLTKAGRQLPRRRVEATFNGNLNEVNRTLQKNQNLQKFVSLPLKTNADKILWEQNLVGWLQSCDREVAGIWLAQVAEVYFAKGDLLAASMTLDFLLTHYGEHPLATISLATLAQFVSSREMRIAAGISQSNPQKTADEKRNDVVEAAFQTQPPQVEKSGDTNMIWLPKNSRTDESSGESNLQTGIVSIPDSTPDKENEGDGPESHDSNAHEIEKQYWENAIQHFVRLRQRDPELCNHPQMRALEAHVMRHLDEWPKISNLYRQLVLSKTIGPSINKWAADEIQLHSENSAKELPMIVCESVPTRPRLDGLLNDEVWQNIIGNGAANFHNVKNSNESIQADLVALGYDSEFLFIGIRCAKQVGVLYPELTGPRKRNPVLAPFDRVEIAFDIDRDQSCPIRLSIDSRGCVSDVCGQLSAWEPEWFVASMRSETHWSLEAAIPWSQLGGLPEQKQIWGVGLARYLPRKTDNVWDTFAPSVNTGGFLKFPTIGGGGFGLLVFE